MAAVFPYFSAKRQQGGKFIKCAEVRTKKMYAANVECCKKLYKKRAVMCFGKFEKVRAKKEFCNTVYARGKCRKMPTKKEFLYTIRAGEKLQKVTQKKNVHQDISDTIKRELLKNTNIRGLYWKLLIIANVIRHIGRVVEQIGKTPGKAAAVSFIFLVLKKILQIPQPLKGIRSFRSP